MDLPGVEPGHVREARSVLTTLGAGRLCVKGPGARCRGPLPTVLERPPLGPSLKCGIQISVASEPSFEGVIDKPINGDHLVFGKLSELNMD